MRVHGYHGQKLLLCDRYWFQATSRINDIATETRNHNYPEPYILIGDSGAYIPLKFFTFSTSLSRLLMLGVRDS